MEFCINVVLFYNAIDQLKQNQFNSSQRRYSYQDTRKDKIVHWYKGLLKDDWQICGSCCSRHCSFQIYTYSSLHTP